MRLSDWAYPIGSFAICFVILLCDRIYTGRWRRRSARCRSYVQAEVAGVHKIRTGAAGRRRTRYRVMARYPVDGIEVTGSGLAGAGCTHEAGDRIMVRYDPAFPASFLLPEDDDARLMRQTLFHIVLALAFFVMGWTFVYLMLH